MAEHQTTREQRLEAALRRLLMLLTNNPHGANTGEALRTIREALAHGR